MNRNAIVTVLAVIALIALGVLIGMRLPGLAEFCTARPQATVLKHTVVTQPVKQASSAATTQATQAATVSPSTKFVPRVVVTVAPSGATK